MLVSMNTSRTTAVRPYPPRRDEEPSVPFLLGACYPEALSESPAAMMSIGTDLNGSFLRSSIQSCSCTSVVVDHEHRHRLGTCNWRQILVHGGRGPASTTP